MKPVHLVLAAGVVFAGGGLAMAQFAGAEKPSAEVLFEGSKTILGEQIAYPSGTPKMTAAIVTLPVGSETGWHVHGAPMYARVLEGTLIVDYGSKGPRTYQTGESLIEAINWPHNGRNAGSVPVRILTVYATADGVANSAPAAAPQ